MMMAPIISKAVAVDAIVVQKLDTHTASEQTRDFRTMTIVVTLIISKGALASQGSLLKFYTPSPSQHDARTWTWPHNGFLAR